MRIQFAESLPGNKKGIFWALKQYNIEWVSGRCRNVVEKSVKMFKEFLNFS